MPDNNTIDQQAQDWGRQLDSQKRLEQQGPDLPPTPDTADAEPNRVEDPQQQKAAEERLKIEKRGERAAKIPGTGSIAKGFYGLKVSTGKEKEYLKGEEGKDLRKDIQEEVGGTALDITTLAIGGGGAALGKAGKAGVAEGAAAKEAAAKGVKPVKGAPKKLTPPQQKTAASKLIKDKIASKAKKAVQPSKVPGMDKLTEKVEEAMLKPVKRMIGKVVIGVFKIGKFIKKMQIIGYVALALIGIFAITILVLTLYYFLTHPCEALEFSPVLEFLRPLCEKVVPGT